MSKKNEIAIHWFRRDLRLNDNAALVHALTSGRRVQPVFIFDHNILSKLEDSDDARVAFIHQQLGTLNQQLKRHHTAIAIYHDRPEIAWKKIIQDFEPAAVYYNHDYEPYARERDQRINDFLTKEGLGVFTFKDQVIFEKNELLKADGTPYTVYTPYKNKWYAQLDNQDYHILSASDGSYHTYRQALPSLKSLGFEATSQAFPDKHYKGVMESYSETRDIPSDEHGTSRMSLHLRFGTVSIRRLVQEALQAKEKTWLDELVWREFFMMILWHFPHTTHKAFKKAYDGIRWRNDEKEFETWCAGQTGYPLVDAGMRQLNETGFMHNRVRMVVASFLCKHLLIDWRWGEAYFARKLQDYEQSSNVGNWQWAAGSGTDAAPYFRVFNPELQQKKFDPNLEYIKRWVPEFDDPFKYPKPIVEHKKARERALEVYKHALNDEL
ncbi:deoxyribodipyrimidine photo-lyase [Olivibacter sp. SDN3]|uniref:cryptochrome/photolyase family protein n=1 Tax=Olivibacter sp. SDN3 TaxID=2764720 RepID=UPI001650E78A|nr:deoxyribodipyrimidine photo-lyase [Olivibacter sp. SDN3]QNL51468.1 deoxyribodipyrimidine photo-lyase [Olivibacter sp. SDN3]